MLALLEILFIIILVFGTLTEVIIPMINDKPLFGSFRKSKDKSTLNDKVELAKSKVEEIKKVQSEVKEHFKTAEELKNDADNLLK